MSLPHLIPKRALSKVEQVVVRLRRLIDEDSFAGGSLPSEPELARIMDASRATVRQALAQLELDGLIIRKHGRGTFVNQQVQAIATRLEEVWDFEEMIRLAGYQSDVRHQTLRRDPAAAELAAKLALETGDEIITTANVFLADGVPVIYCEDVIPARLVQQPYHEEELHGPVYTFLARRCHQRVQYNITEIQAVTADAVLAARLHCEVGSPLHYFDETGFNADHQPVIYSKEYYRPEFFNFKVIRRMVTSGE